MVDITIFLSIDEIDKTKMIGDGSHHRSQRQRAKQHARDYKDAQMVQDLRTVIGRSRRCGSRRGGRAGSIALHRPVCIHGGVAGKDRGGGDLDAAHRLGIPAVKGIALQLRAFRHGGKPAVQVGGDDHGGTRTAHGVQSDGESGGLLRLLCKCSGKGTAQQRRGEQTDKQRFQELFHVFPHFPDRFGRGTLGSGTDLFAPQWEEGTDKPGKGGLFFLIITT